MNTASTLGRAVVACAASALFVACGAPVVAEDDGQPLPDAGVDLPDAGAEADAGTEPPGPCGEDEPYGTCPSGRVCRDGGCIVDFDPGVPVDDPAAAVAEFEAIWQFYAERYGAFPTRSLDWNALGQSYSGRIAQAQTRFEAQWLTQQAVAELGDGHTGLYSNELCTVTEYIGSAYSNLGACVVEADGRLLVNRVGAKNPLGVSLGDEIVDIDGRSGEQLLRDLALQPRCSHSASTPAQARRKWVAGVMQRVSTDRTVRVRTPEGEEHTRSVPAALAANEWMACTERPPLPELTAHGAGVFSAELPADLLYVHLAMFGTYDAQGNFVIEPVITALREAFTLSSGKAGLILDLRDNPGGSPQVYLALASWPYDQPTRLFTCQDKAGPGMEDFTSPWEMWAQPDATLQFTGPVAVVINATTFSAGDFSSGFLHATGRARTFGHPSGGGFGNGTSWAWSEDLTAGYNDILCRDIHGRLLEGSPPPVDVPVTWTRADLVAGRDPVVEAAVADLLGQ